MNGLDFVVIAVIGLSGLFAFARGFVREALSIVAWIGAAAARSTGLTPSTTPISKFVTAPLARRARRRRGLFLVSLIVLTILTGYAARLVQAQRRFGDRPHARLDLRHRRAGRRSSRSRYLLLDIGLPPSERPNWIREAKCEPLFSRGRRLAAHVHTGRLAAESFVDSRGDAPQLRPGGRSRAGDAGVGEPGAAAGPARRAALPAGRAARPGPADRECALAGGRSILHRPRISSRNVTIFLAAG